MTRARLHSLGKLAQVVHDHELSRTSRLAHARDATRARLVALSAPVPLADDPACIAARQTHLTWAMGQRIALNQRLAAQTAQLMEQRRRTARSLGRIEALSRLIAAAQKRARSDR